MLSALDARRGATLRYKKNLGEDKTELLFSREELEGLDAAWLAERAPPAASAVAGHAHSDGGLPARSSTATLRT